jgi:hypothetical protein
VFYITLFHNQNHFFDKILLSPENVLCTPGAALTKAGVVLSMGEENKPKEDDEHYDPEIERLIYNGNKQVNTPFASSSSASSVNVNSPAVAGQSGNTMDVENVTIDATAVVVADETTEKPVVSADPAAAADAATTSGSDASAPMECEEATATATATATETEEVKKGAPATKGRKRKADSDNAKEGAGEAAKEKAPKKEPVKRGKAGAASKATKAAAVSVPGVVDGSASTTSSSDLCDVTDLTEETTPVEGEDVAAAAAAAAPGADKKASTAPGAKKAGAAKASAKKAAAAATSKNDIGSCFSSAIAAGTMVVAPAADAASPAAVPDAPTGEGTKADADVVVVVDDDAADGSAEAPDAPAAPAATPAAASASAAPKKKRASKPSAKKTASIESESLVVSEGVDDVVNVAGDASAAGIAPATASSAKKTTKVAVPITYPPEVEAKLTANREKMTLLVQELMQLET